MVGDQMSKYSRNCLVEHLFFSFWLFFLYFDRNDPVRVVPQKNNYNSNDRALVKSFYCRLVVRDFLSY